MGKKTKNVESYLLPRIDDTLDALSQAQYFCMLDLVQGYHKMELSELANPKTAFLTPRISSIHLEINYMPFGVTGDLGTFQRLMDKILREL